MGTGLGLSQVHGFVRQSGGQVRIHSEVGKGTTVRLYLPRSTAVPEPARVAPAKPVRGPKRHLTVLLVEDEEGVRDFAAEALVELGYDVLATQGAQPALELMDARHDIAVLLTDVVMPETNGRVLAEEALKRLPFLKVVYMTGYTRDVIVHNGVLDADTHLINKPFTVAQLGAEIEAALGEGPRPNA
jgi:CheY-like chemotaxis protein